MKQEKHNELTSNYDVVARSWKQEVIFEAGTTAGEKWILRNWGCCSFVVRNLLTAAQFVKRMNEDGLEVALLCGV